MKRNTWGNTWPKFSLHLGTILSPVKKLETIFFAIWNFNWNKYYPSMQQKYLAQLFCFLGQYLTRFLTNKLDVWTSLESGKFHASQVAEGNCPERKEEKSHLGSKEWHNNQMTRQFSIQFVKVVYMALTGQIWVLIFSAGFEINTFACTQDVSSCSAAADGKVLSRH